MSFSLVVQGSGTNVQTKVEAAFDKVAENCKSVPHEAESILLAKEIAMKQVAFYTTLKQDAPGIMVACNGHASFYGDGDTKRGDSTFILEVKPLYGFVEG